jgi:hypothetical protein
VAEGTQAINATVNSDSNTPSLSLVNPLAGKITSFGIVSSALLPISSTFVQLPRDSCRWRQAHVTE